MDTFLFGAALIGGSAALCTGLLILLALTATFVTGVRRWRRGGAPMRGRRRFSVRPIRPQPFRLQAVRAPHHGPPPAPAPLPVSPAPVSRPAADLQDEEAGACIRPAAAGALE